jgi:hypothetical protein
MWEHEQVVFPYLKSGSDGALLNCKLPSVGFLIANQESQFMLPSGFRTTSERKMQSQLNSSSAQGLEPARLRIQMKTLLSGSIIASAANILLTAKAILKSGVSN